MVVWTILDHFGRAHFPTSVGSLGSTREALSRRQGTVGLETLDLLVIARGEHHEACLT